MATFDEDCNMIVKASLTVFSLEISVMAILLTLHRAELIVLIYLFSNSNKFRHHSLMGLEESLVLLRRRNDNDRTTMQNSKKSENKCLHTYSRTSLQKFKNY